MKSIDTKSVLLGLGIGIVLTSLISMIYVAGMPEKQMTRQEIIAKAKSYGLIEPAPIIREETQGTTGQNTTVQDTAED